MLRPPSEDASLTVPVGIAAGFLLFTLLGHWQADFRPEDAGLGRNTTAASDSFEGHRISAHSARLDLEDLGASFRELRGEGRAVALWLGASQLHAINFVQPDDHLAVFFANQASESRGSALRYLQVSDPNANLNELLAVYLQFRGQHLVPDVLVLALTYDDLREPGVRESILENLPTQLDLPVTHRAGLANLEAAGALARERPKRAVKTLDAMENTPQEHVEDRLTDFLDRNWSAYAHRGQLASWLEVNVLRIAYRLRSDATRHRVPPVPRPLERWNLAALDTLLEVAALDGVQVLVYKAPHRPGMRPFYHDRAAYDRFFVELSTSLARLGVHYADLETIVPEELWGETNDGNPDVFHFRGRGHRILGAQVDAELAKLGL